MKWLLEGFHEVAQIRRLTGGLPALLGSSKGLYLVVLLVSMAFLVKLVGALAYAPLLSWREVLGLGMLTSARLSLIIAVAEIAVELGAITEVTNSAIILVAIVTVFVSPVMFNRIIPAVEQERRRLLIVGAPPHARLLAQRLLERGERVTLVTANPRFFEESQFPGDALILSIARNGEVIIPRGHTELHHGDLLTLIGSAESVERSCHCLTG